MSDVTRDLHWPWLGFALEEALKLGITDAQDVVGFATPDLLVAQLPHETTTLLLTRALSSGTLTPASVLETAPPALLAEHLESEILWRCLTEAAARAQLTQKGGVSNDDGKQWLGAILQHALDTGLVTPADVLRFVPPAEFVRDAPLAVMAEMIRTGLTKGNFDPDLVLVHLTPKVMAENLQTSLLWACLADAVASHFEIGAQPAAASSVKDTGPIVTSAAVEKLASAKIEPVVTRKPAVPPTPKIAPSEWSSPDDLEVLDEKPLPPPPMARKG
ncbi:MAG TPA: hypothetical protein VFF06_28735 [Polyangia bacterium]|nr:hypothetical protein [Polyangia bacterium]